MRWLFLITYLMFPLYASGQTSSIRGKLYSMSGEPVDGAQIYSPATQKVLSTTSIDGTFIIENKNDTILCFVAAGYRDTCLNLKQILSSEVIKLETKNTYAREVVISAQTKEIRSVQTGQIQFKTDSLFNLPSILGEADPMKILQLTPGVSKSDFNLGINVRGSTTDQNMILTDDAVIYNPTHLAGFLSVFNPLVVEKFSLIKSGIPAEYGGRISSVLIVETDKTPAQHTQVEASVGLLLSGIKLKTPLIKETLSLVIAARKSYIDQTIKPISRMLPNTGSVFNNTRYGFYDLNAGLIYNAGPKDKFYFNCYAGNDDFSLSKASFNLGYDMQWGNQAYSLKWVHMSNSTHTYKTIFYHSAGDFAIFLGQNDFNFNLNSSIKDYSVLHEHKFYIKKLILSSGISVLKQDVIPNKSKASLNEMEANFGTPNNFNTITTSAYIQANYELTNKISLALGLRYNRYDHLGPFERYIRSDGINISDTISYNKYTTVKTYSDPEPRFSLRILLDSFSSLKFSFTRNVQYLQQVNVSSVSLPTDFWMPSSWQLKPQEGIQTSLGYFRELLQSGYFVSFDVFYKQMNHLTEFKKGVLSAVSKASMEENIISGKGKAYGLEFIFEKKTGTLTGWISYTLSRSERIFSEINQGKAYPSKYDRTHDLSVLAQYAINAKWKSSLVFVFASGSAVNLPYGRYMVGQNIVNQYMDYNSFRMPVYHRLDISFTRIFLQKNKLEHQLNFGVYNLYGRQNPFFMYFSVTGDIGKYKLKVQPKYVSVFPVLPFVTYYFKF